jgi:hypothetical protein
VAYRFGTGEEAAFTRPYPKSGNHCSLLESAFLEREPRKHVCGQADNVPMWDSRAGTSVSASGLNTNTSGTLAILIGRLTIGVYPTPRPPGRGPQLVSRLPPGGRKVFSFPRLPSGQGEQIRALGDQATRKSLGLMQLCSGLLHLVAGLTVVTKTPTTILSYPRIG